MNYWLPNDSRAFLGVQGYCMLPRVLYAIIVILAISIFTVGALNAFDFFAPLLT